MKVNWDSPITTKSDMSDIVFDFVVDRVADEEDGCFVEIRVEYCEHQQHFYDVVCVDYITGECKNPYLSPDFDIVNLETRKEST